MTWSGLGNTCGDERLGRYGFTRKLHLGLLCSCLLIARAPSGPPVRRPRPDHYI